jgi:two-component system sensor histidine kinase KdpD
LYFVVAIVLGQLVTRIRTQEKAERQREERAIALYQLTRELAQAGTRDEVVWQLLGEITRVFRATAAVVLPGSGGLGSHPDGSLVLTEKELHVAEWAFLHRQAAGKFTDNLPGSEALHLPLATERAVLGVLSVGLPERTLTVAQRDLLEAYVRQAALVLDRVALRGAAEQSKLIAESERLSKALLDSISHELRTPLAAITSAASALAGPPDASSQLRRAMTAEIQEAAARLNRLVGNLLDVTRLESGRVQAKLDWCDVGDVLQATVRSLERELSDRAVTIEVADGLARKEQNDLVLIVADHGPGLPEELLPRIFEKFIRAPDAKVGGSGLGLAIVKGFVEAQGGRITAQNRPGGGAMFAIHVPQKENPPSVPKPA